MKKIEVLIVAYLVQKILS